MAKIISGTREWAKKNINCVTGCSHNCRYCYARTNAVRFGYATVENWHIERIREHDVKKKIAKVKDTPKGGMDIMFPTTHDISPGTIDACLTTLEHILESGNTVLITSKPHLECIKAICNRFLIRNWAGSNQIMFRFTIGCMDNDILKYWEPNAPLFEERFEALKYAFDANFRTSISVEPCLDTDNVVKMFNVLKPFITNSFWIGKMNKVRKRVSVVTQEDESQVQRIESKQSDVHVRMVYSFLKDEPLVYWKESYKQVLGLPLAEEAGEDK